ncbi:hypothetical protein E3N88_28587 [Mikania micrantha]|uniref:Agenet domain-containing protein n=1 Tax=Mikania micrantha TaxID=192012 RepID=A0A5N6N0W4_9ASTR|nr:hypothetical protein E3N88_28587 [Mikania micrantha]
MGGDGCIVWSSGGGFDLMMVVVEECAIVSSMGDSTMESACRAVGLAAKGFEEDHGEKVVFARLHSFSRYFMEASTMEKPDVLNFKVGQLAEMRTFEVGYRSAWFRCKIMDILPEKNKILLEYYDFDLDDPSWVEIYQEPPYAKKSNHIKRQLMVRPEYPVVYCKSEIPCINSILQAGIVIDGSWKVGDLVDWSKDDCYWSARIVEVLGDNMFKIELPLRPVGEGKRKERRHKAHGKDLRPSLDWSETEGWSLPAMEGQTSCDAHLIFPTNQGMDLEVEHAAAVSPVNASSTTRVSAAEGDGDSEQNVKTNGDLMESSESSSSLHVKIRKDAVAADEEEKRALNVMREHTLEAALLDLEEIINKVNWMQRILQSRSNDATSSSSSSWKFA